MSSNFLLKAEGISKSFPGVKALSDVHFNLRRGEIHSLMGENGAGKSTLIKVLTGVHEKNTGTFYLGSQKIEPKSPQDAQRLGISTVYQEINLCENLTVAENIFIGREPKKTGRIDWKEINQRSEKILSERLNINIDVNKILSSDRKSVV